MEQFPGSAVDQGNHYRNSQGKDDAPYKGPGHISQKDHQCGINTHLTADTDVHVSHGIYKYSTYRHQRSYDHVGH